MSPPLCATTSLPPRPLSSPLSRPRVVSVNTLNPPPSPKRARQTPSPSAHASSSGSSGPKISSTSSLSAISNSTRSRTRATRPTLADKRAVTFERHVTTSPYCGPEYSNGDCRLARRRELSVPLLSQSLSHFSLTHTSPPTPNRQPGASLKMMSELYATQPADATKTPRNHSRRQDGNQGPPLPSELSYPSTAPLPHAASFLGSPFSSKTARGQYRFSGSDESPSRTRSGAMTERIPQGSFGDQMDWMHGRQFSGIDGEVEEEGKEELSPVPAARQQRVRRDTSGSSSSTTSMDDYSCSGTSSASLLSLGRSSDEHRVRPGVLIWGEQNIEEEARPATPRHKLFVPTSDSDDALQISLGPKPKKATPSPVQSASKGRLPHISPLQQFINRSASTRSVTPPDSAVPAKSRKSPFANFMPRLLSVRRPTLSRTNSLAVSVQSIEDEAEATDTEDASSPCNRSLHPSTSTVCDSPTARVGQQATLVGLGISSADKANSSFSSESSIEIASPSKPPSGLNSRTHLSTLILSPGPLPRPTSSRRKTVAAVDLLPNDKPSTTTTERAKAFRPLLRRGITEPRMMPGMSAKLLGPDSAHTPPSTLFNDTKPSPAAFASTGLVKKKSALPILQIPKFGLKSSPAGSVSSATTSSLPSRGHRTGPSIDTISSGKASGQIGHGAPPTGQAVPRSRGLRRKTSTMFTASGSFGDSKAFSPVTPTKPVLHITPLSNGVHTPIPATPTSYYPFASSASILSISTPTSTLTPGTSPTEVVHPGQALPARLMREHKGPVARASNPMLAAAYRADATYEPVPAQSPATQNRLDRDFVLVQSLGAGAFSQVWKVRDKKEGKLWAVKAGKPYTGVKSRLRQLEEVSILHSLTLDSNPHIIQFADSWEHRNRLYLRTELAECGDLSRFLNALGDTGGLGEIRCWKLLAELSDALKHVHSHNILHLDLKPSNVLITRSGSLKLADFGMSTISDLSGRAADLSPALPVLGVDGEFVWSDSSEEAEVVKQGSERRIETVPSPIVDREVEGDREYLCPEALEDGSIGREADVFSLGIMLLEAVLNVVLPSNGDGWVKLRTDDFTDLAEHYIPRQKGDSRQVTEEGVPVISERVLEVIRGMMRADREDRWRLADVMRLGEMERVKAAMEDRRLGAACVDEDTEMMGVILAH